MPLHFGKVGALIAIVVIAAFLLWLMFGAFLEGETVEQDGAGLKNDAALATTSSVFSLPGAPRKQK